MELIILTTVSIFIVGCVVFRAWGNIYLGILYIMPKTLISQFCGWLATKTIPKFIFLPLLSLFCHIYNVQMHEATYDLSAYRTFNQFFIRTLKPSARIISPGQNTIISPVDGTVLNYGRIRNGTLIQVKNYQYSLQALLGDHPLSKKFLHGSWVTIYLAPGDYHRIHFPITGNVLGYIYKYGNLFPVNTFAVHKVDQLFAQNERLITFLQSSKALLAVVKVGAMIVGKIKITYDSIQYPEKSRLQHNQTSTMYTSPIPIQKGDELGHFELGSTVIILMENDRATIVLNEESQPIKMGQAIATLN